MDIFGIIKSDPGSTEISKTERLLYFDLIVVSNKIEAVCFQMRRAVSGTDHAADDTMEMTPEVILVPGIFFASCFYDPTTS